MKLILASILIFLFAQLSIGQLQITSVEVQHETCFEASDGIITVTATGIVGDATYDIGFGPQSSNVFYDVPCGDYIVTAADDNGMATDLATVDCATQVTAWVDTYPATFGNCDGTAYVYASGGTPPYTYTFSENPDMSFPLQSGTQPDIYGLCGNFTYYVTVTDANGCGAPGNGGGTGPDDGVISFEILEMTPMIASVSILQNSCEGMCNGQAYIEVQGGTPPYTITNPNGGSDISFNENITFTDMCPGIHTLVLYDGFGQIETINITIEETIILPNVLATDESSNGACDGTLTANPTGGDVPYNYSWTTCSSTNPVWTNQEVTDACAGEYQVTVTDINGCSTTSECVTVGTTTCNLDATANVLEETCPGSCVGVVDIIPSNGTAPYTLTFDGNDYPFTVNYILSNLCQGIQQYSIEDANGCTYDGSFEIFETPLQIDIMATSESAPGACDGTLSIDPMSIGGYDPYTFTWFECGTSNQVGNTSTVEDVCAGIYEILVSDNRGCIAVSESCVTVDSNPCNLSATESIYHYACTGNPCAGEVDITPSGGTAPYTLTYDENDYSFTGNIILGNVCQGMQPYSIEDANGCIYTGTIDMMLLDMMYVAPTATDETVSGACDGTVTVDPLTIGGSDPYYYNWSNCNTFETVGGNNSSVTDLCPGQFELMVTDIYGCIAVSNCVTVNGGTAGINEIEYNNSMLLYPIPVENTLHISTDLPIDQLAISDASGKQLIQKSSLIVKETTLNTENLLPGVYFIKITSTDGTFIQRRFVKR